MVLYNLVYWTYIAADKISKDMAGLELQVWTDIAEEILMQLWYADSTTPIKERKKETKEFNEGKRRVKSYLT